MPLNRNQNLSLQRMLRGFEDGFEVPEDVVDVIERISQRCLLDHRAHFGGAEHLAIALELGELTEEVKALRQQVDELRGVEKVEFNWRDVDVGTPVEYPGDGDVMLTGHFNGWPENRWRGKRIFVIPDEDSAKQITVPVGDAKVLETA